MTFRPDTIYLLLFTDYWFCNGRFGGLPDLISASLPTG